jgi:hypothetical protein
MNDKSTALVACTSHSVLHRARDILASCPPHPAFHNQPTKAITVAQTRHKITTRLKFTTHSTTNTYAATMPGKIIPVTSASHFETLLNSSTYTIVDFYADWCGPCKAIAPVFQTLAEKETKPGKLQFVKVDVDSQQEVAKKYGVSAYVYSSKEAKSKASR